MELVIVVYVTQVKGRNNKRERKERLVVFCCQKYISVLSIESNNIGVFVKWGTVKTHKRGYYFWTTVCDDKTRKENETDRQRRDNFPHKKHFYLLIPTFISGAWMNPPEGQRTSLWMWNHLFSPSQSQATPSVTLKHLVRQTHLTGAMDTVQV